MIQIDTTGAIGPLDERDTQSLRPHAGSYRLVTAGAGMLVLGRTGATTGTPRILMAGEIPRAGWTVEILSFVCNSRLSGLLTVLCAGVRRELFFDLGALRLDRSSAARDLLGEFLVNQGVLQRVQIEQALGVDPAGRKLGQTLVDLGFLTLPQLYEQLQRRTESIFNQTVSLCEGLYWFSKDADLSKLPSTLYMDTQAMLMEGLRHIDELNYYRTTIPRRTMILEHTAGVIESCTEEERAIIARVDGRLPLSEIGGALELADEHMVTIAHGLVSRGLLELLPRQEVEEQTLRAVVESFNKALEVVYGSAPDSTTRSQLVGHAMDFLKNGGHNNTILREIAPTDKGLLNYTNIRTLYESSTEHDRIKLIVIVLTRFLSFVLFNAGERLPQTRQEELSIRVYGALGDILAATQ